MPRKAASTWLLTTATTVLTVSSLLHIIDQYGEQHQREQREYS